MNNKRSGRVALPEAGDDAYLLLDVEALEKLETHFSDVDDFIPHIIKGLAELRPKAYKVATEAMLRNGDPSQMPFGMGWSEYNLKLLDAIHYSIHGKPYAEVKAEHEAKMLARLKGIQEDPETAAALQSLFSQVVGEPAPSAD